MRIVTDPQARSTGFVPSGSSISVCQDVSGGGCYDRKAIPARGGVIGVNFVSGFLTQAASNAQRPIYAKYRPQLKGHPERWREVFTQIAAEVDRTELPPLAAIADHVDHVVAVAGIDAVALGSDFDGFTHGPAGLTGCEDFPSIVGLLEQRGYSATDLRKIGWENWQRVLATTFG